MLIQSIANSKECQNELKAIVAAHEATNNLVLNLETQQRIA
jgi:hypothetical protein